MKKLIYIIAIFAISVLTTGPVATARAADGNAALNQNLILNAGFETAGATDASALNWASYGLGNGRRTSTYHTGKKSFFIQNRSTADINGVYQRVDLNQAEIKPVFIGGYVRGSGIISAPGSYFGASLYVEIHLRDGSVAYWNSIANLGSFSWRWIGFNTGTLSAVNQPIDYLFVVPLLGNAKGYAYFDDLTVAEANPSQSAVTIMFDDGDSTIFSAGKPLLDQYQYPASTSIITSYIGDDGFMDQAQLLALQQQGWEIVSHSINHQDMTIQSDIAVKRELRESKFRLETLGLTVNNFAMPFGAYNGYILGEAARYGYSSARAFEQGDNPQGAFPFDVKVRGIINTTTASEVQGWLQSAIANKHWLVLVFHSIAASGDDAYFTTPAALQQMLQDIAASGLPVLTYNQALQKFAVQPQ